MVGGWGKSCSTYWDINFVSKREGTLVVGQGLGGVGLCKSVSLPEV